MLADVTDANFQAEVIDQNQPVLVDFWAEWCAPCKVTDPVLEHAAQELGERVKIVKLNCGDNPEITSKYGVRNMPTYLLFKGGEVVDMKVGATLTNSGFVKWLEEFAA